MRAPILASLVLLSGCSVITGGFAECEVASDCGDGRTCSAGYCVEPGCNDIHGAADDPNAIALAAALPMTVSDGSTDQSELQGLNAMKLAIDEINQRQGVGGRQFALHICDTTGDSEKVKQQLQYLADTRNVPAVITSGSGQTVAASSVTIPGGMLLMSATATSPEITNLSDKPDGAETGLVWRTAPSDAIQGRVIADLLLNPNTYGLDTATKIAIVYVNDVYGQGLAGELRTRLTETGTGKTVTEWFYARGEADAELRSLVDGLDGDDPDLTVMIGFPDDLSRLLPLAIAKTNLQKDSGHRWLFTDAAKDPTILADAAVKDELQGAYGTAPAQGAGSAYAAFKSRFQNAYSVNPDDFSFTSHSYDAVYLLALATAHAAGTGDGTITGAGIAEGLTQLSSGAAYPLEPTKFTEARGIVQQGTAIDVAGASGELDFDPATGEAPSPIEIWQIDTSGENPFVSKEKREPPA